MQRGENESMSVWQAHEKPEPKLSPLSQDIYTDVCIVGAGIAGLTTAYMLAKERKSVVIVDAWGLAAGETSRTTAHLTAVLDERFFNLESLFGKDGTKLAAESHMSAINRIENIVNEEQIDCDFERVDGYLVALDAEQQKDFDKEIEPIKEAGFADRETLSQVPVGDIKINHPTMRIPRQATFNIAKYMAGLASIYQRLGGKIYTGSHVKEVIGGEAAYVKTDDGFKVHAKHIVIATNTPINDWVKMHTKQAAYRSYVIGYQIPKDTYPSFLLWDMEEPYHYVRIVRGDVHDTLIVGGEDHKTGQADDTRARYQRLDAWAQQYFITLGPIIYRWSGQIMEAVDCLAFIGHNPMDKDNVYIVTGDSGNGITYSTIAGMLITDLIQGRENPWKEIYEPSRKSLKAVGTYIEENANVVGCMVKDWVAPSEVESVDDIRIGEGAILRKGVSKIAVYRDEQGQLHERSAVCTHLGCVVQWNGGEKSWDCPCHGSRFDVDGKILNGPAIRPLGVVREKVEHKQMAGA